MLTVGLTGDVGAGKSTVAACWKGQGATVVDTDEIVRELWKTERLKRAALERFGLKVLKTGNGDLDPSFLSARVFSSRADYDWVCSLLHPLVFEEVKRALQNGDGWFVIEIPLLFETGRPGWLDLAVYVSAPEEERVSRTGGRGWGKEDLKAREKWLLPSVRKTGMADILIENGGALEDLRRKVFVLGEKMKEIAVSIARWDNLDRQTQERFIREMRE